MTYIPFSHTVFAKIGYMTPPSHRQARKCNPTIGLEGRARNLGGLHKWLLDLVVSGRVGFWIPKLSDSKTRFYKTTVLYALCLEFWGWGYAYCLTLCWFMFVVRVIFLRQPRLNLLKLRITLPSQLLHYESWSLGLWQMRAWKSYPLG